MLLSQYMSTALGVFAVGQESVYMHVCVHAAVAVCW